MADLAKSWLTRLLIAFWFLGSLPSAAFAQSVDLPPQESMRDGNDVDLLNSTYVPDGGQVSVGTEDNGITYKQTGNAGLSNGNLLYTVTIGPYIHTVSLGTESKAFDRASDGTFTSKGRDGSTLTESASGFVYTDRDGTVVTFTKFYGSRRILGQSGYVGTQIVAPSGRVTTFTYKTYGTDGLRLQSVNSNTGHQIKLFYASSTSGDVTSVKAINTAADYCDPAADTCASLTQAWQTVSVNRQTDANGIGTILRTDAGGNVWTATFEGDIDGNLTAESLRRPTETQNNVRVVYKVVQAIDRGDFTNITAPYLFKPVKITSVTRPGQVWTYQFGRPTGIGLQWRAIVTDPAGAKNTFQVEGVVTGTSRIFIDPLNRTSRFELDGYGRYFAAKPPELNIATAALDDRGNNTQLTLTPKTGSGLANIISSVSVSATCTNMVTCNKPASYTDPLDNVTDFTYSPVHGGVLTATLPAPTVGGVRPQKRYTYGQFYAWYKNSAGTLVQAPSPIWLVTQISECRTGAAPACIDTGDETRTTFTYGAAGTPNNLNVTQVTVAAGDNSVSATTNWTYDVFGNKLTEDGPQSGTADTTRWRYDAMRRVIGVIAPDPDGAGPLKFRATRNTYDAIGRLVKVEVGTVNSQSDADWALFSPIQTVETTYDTLDRKTKVWTYGTTGGTQSLTQFSYDAVGRPECTAVRMNPAAYGSLPASACTLGTQGSDGPDRITKLTYDAAGQVSKITLAYGTVDQADDQTNTYTLNGKLATVTDGENNTTTLEYDGHDRLSKSRYPVPAIGALASSTTDYEQLTYDAGSRIIQDRRRDGQLISFSYDALGRMTFKDVPNTVTGEYDVSTSYDNLGRPINVTDTQNNFVGAGYDALGRMSSQSSPNGTFAMTYDAAGRLTRITHPDAVFFTYSYNTSDLTGILEGTSTSLVGYTYDNLGRRTSVTRGNLTTTNYTWDPVGRLGSYGQDLGGTANDVTWRGPNVGTLVSYNPAGQLNSITRDNDTYAWNGHYNVNRAYGTNGLNQLTSAGATALGYDGRGNLTSSGSDAYSYTSENRLATGPGGVTLYYDPTGRMSRLVQGATTTRFEYLGPRLVIERDAGGNILRRYVHGPSNDEPLVWYEGAGLTTKRWLHTDERGSVIAITDATGASIATLRYDEYGIPQSGNAGRFQYTGQAWVPELGLYYYKARFYSPTLGRFLQTDPVGYGDGVNWYAYVDDDPVNRVDPTGLCTGSLISKSDGQCAGGGFISGVGSCGGDCSIRKTVWTYNPRQGQNAAPIGHNGGPPLLETAAAVCTTNPLACVAVALPFLVSGDTPQPPKDIGPLPTDQNVNLIRNLRTHNLDLQTLEAARLEKRGNFSIINPATLRPYDHIQKVREAQNALRGRISWIHKILSNPNMTQGQRYYYINELSDASRLLDFSKGYIP